MRLIHKFQIQWYSFQRFLLVANPQDNIFLNLYCRLNKTLRAIQYNNCRIKKLNILVVLNTL